MLGSGIDADACESQQLVGSADSFQETCGTIDLIARRRSTVMLLGETGTGKELLARRIHSQSDRAENPFVPVDCSSISSSLFESELFGHVSGAFTGANRDSLGFIRAADGGTLFLDEVGELELPLQAKLLRVLQERRVTPVGDARSHPVNVRVICATHRDIPRMVREQRFREDLFFRLNTVTIRVPPLRERVEDIIPLAMHFLRMQSEFYAEPCKSLLPDARDALLAHDWPGNVRELANVIEAAHVLSEGLTIGAMNLPATMRKAHSISKSGKMLRTLDDVQRQAIAEALKETHHNKAAASRYLGIPVQRLTRMMSKLGILPC